MDNLVLIRVADALRRSLTGAVVTDLREEPPHRFRLLLSMSERPRTVLVSIDPTLPWLGRPQGRRRRLRSAPGVFAAPAARRLRGAALVDVTKPAADRCVTLHFSDGRALAVELLPHGANLILIDPRGRIEAVARRSRASRRRLELGAGYRAASPPPGRLDPFESNAAELRGRLRTGCSEGRTEAEVLQRQLLGVGPVGAELAIAEARRGGDDLASVLLQRLAALREGRSDPCVESPVDPEEACEQGTFDEAACRLLPWEPPWLPEEPLRRIKLADAAATAGLYHEAVDLTRMQRRRSGSLVAILEREVRRLREVEIKVTSDMAAFRDAPRLRHWGEALLAGLSQAQRMGEHVLVPDPYDAEQAAIPVPVHPGQDPARAAEGYFARHRRAVRGAERARRRAGEVAERRSRLERLLEAHEERTDPAATDALETAMQGEGIPVGLWAGGRTARGGPRASVSRVEGVRLFLSGDGDAVMVGKSARDNHRLTFKLAGPEDFWLHALGVPGAHVVVRNPRRQSRPSPGTLVDAAEAAAWFSEAREQPQTDVQWTRRKYVRKIRGAPAGTVRVKRSETVRVRPRRPGALEGRG